MGSLTATVRLASLSDEAVRVFSKQSNKSNFLRLAIEEKIARDKSSGGVPSRISDGDNGMDSLLEKIESLISGIKIESSEGERFALVDDKLSLIVKMLGELKNVQSPKNTDDALLMSLDEMEKRIMNRMKFYSDQVIGSIGSVSLSSDVKHVAENAHVVKADDRDDFEREMANSLKGFSFSKKT